MAYMMPMTNISVEVAVPNADRMINDAINVGIEMTMSTMRLNN